MLYGITALSDGSVLTTGGYDVFWIDSNYYSSPALYDPSSEQFTNVPVPVTYTATQLQDGRVLVSGADMYTLLGPTAMSNGLIASLAQSITACVRSTR